MKPRAAGHYRDSSSYRWGLRVTPAHTQCDVSAAEFVILQLYADTVFYGVPLFFWSAFLVSQFHIWPSVNDLAACTQPLLGEWRRACRGSHTPISSAIGKQRNSLSLYCSRRMDGIVVLHRFSVQERHRSCMVVNKLCYSPNVVSLVVSARLFPHHHKCWEK